jgi:copper transport protein
MRTTSSLPGMGVRWATALLVCVAALVLGPSTASAHTEFVSSSPADGETVEGPLSTIVISFTNPAVESGDGFELLAPDGSIRTPSAVDPGDGTSFEAAFDPPLTVGTYGFRWEVQAGDAHPIDGSFSFEVVSAPGATTTLAPTTGSSSTPTSSVAEDTSTATTDASTGAGGSGTTGGTTSGASDASGAETLEAFLEGGGDAEPFAGRVGRTLSIAGSLFAIGAVAALIWVIRGTTAELAGLLQWVRLAGVALAAGGLIELGALDEVSGTSLGELLTTKAGVAVLLDLVAGALIVVGFSRGSGRMVAVPRSLSAATATVESPAAPEESATSAVRWSPDRTAALGLLGIVAALAAYWFDGHTVSRGPWAVHAAINLVHVTTAGLWAGGVVALTLVVVTRRRRGVGADAVGLVVRFSSIAMVSLALLAVAGAGLAWLVLDGPGELFSTDWGTILLAKVSAVAVAASLGAYNHFKLRPALVRHPDDEVLAGHLRTSLLIESAILAVVVVLTAVLVAASL